MKNLRINLILPFPATKPGGGSKIMYEIANRLQEREHDVMIYHAIKRPFKKTNTPLFIKRLLFAIRKVARPKWFPLHDAVCSVIVPQITNKYIRDADVVMSTWWQMTYAVNALSISKGKKFNFIQGYEIWAGHADKVEASYSLSFHHIVIAKYLEKLLLQKTGKNPIYLPLSIDDKKFFCKIDPHKRNPASVIMLFSKEAVKGSNSGVEALKKVKEMFPHLMVTFFGVENAPENLPPWITYHQRPNDLNQLYNDHAIFISPAISEGWALPPAEAMACGCALVLTNIDGHVDYALDNETALLVPVKDPDAMAEKIILLINNTPFRNKLCSNGMQLMRKQFNWDNTLNKLEKIYLNEN